MFVFSNIVYWEDFAADDVRKEEDFALDDVGKDENFVENAVVLSDARHDASAEHTQPDIPIETGSALSRTPEIILRSMDFYFSFYVRLRLNNFLCYSFLYTESNQISGLR
jgi:hypothetical protein